MDARDDKGAYVITKVEDQITFPEDSIIHWSDFQEGKFTYGLLSQISPDGRYVVSTLRDCEIFADRKDLEYSQLFFPFKGILVIFDRMENRYFELEGANDTTLVQSNPCWTPDVKYIYFTRAKARQFEESGIHNGSVPKAIDAARYHQFEKNYMDRDSLIKFDIFKVPFNDGRGGAAVPVEGASNNGMSNYFPKISPDGKWLVFCKAESFMLLQSDSRLNIIPAEGGEAREMNCNTSNMNSWHSWSPNSKWLVYSTKALSPYTQLFLTHIDENGNDSPPVYLENFSFENYADNIPEFVNIEYDKSLKITPSFLSENDFIIRNGEICLKNGDQDGAFSYFNKAIGLFPKESEPYYQRGRIYSERHDFQKAIDDFNRAIRLEKRAIYYTARGTVQLKLNKYDQAERDLLQAARLDPTDNTPQTYLGILYYNRDEYEKAENCIEKSIELFNGDAYTYYYYGLLNYSRGKAEQANKALTRAIQLRPVKEIEPLVYELRANARFDQRDYAGALNDVKYVINLHPKDPALFLLKGKAELESGMLQDAKRSFQQSQKLGGREAAAYLRQIAANI
ncbi:MAG: tetratricopeptide repeat protein [Draconibacterium sp.]